MIENLNFRELFNTSPSTLLKNLFSRKQKNFNDIYIGVVVSTDDPDKLGRIKVAVFDIFDRIRKEDIPWAYPQSSFIGSKLGSMIIPPIESLVNVRFQNGDLHLPVYLSSKLHLRNSLPSGSSGIDPDNLIFFETDEGDYFEILKGSSKMTLKHSSGASISIDKTGKIHLHGTGLVDDGHSITTANPVGGPFNALLVDPYTGMTHVGYETVSTIPPGVGL